MKSWSKSLWAAALVGIAGPALAQPGGPGCGMHKGARMEQALREAGATDAQVAQVQEQAYQTRKKMIALHAEKEQAELELQRLMSRTPADRDAVLKAVEALGAVKIGIHKLRVEQMLAVRDIVGPEVARQALDGARERWKERQGDRRGGPDRRWKQHPPPPDAGEGPEDHEPPGED